MLATSERFLAALREPHVVAVRVVLIPADGSLERELDVLGGSSTANRGALVRRTCSLELPGGRVTALAGWADLPFGSYVRAERGIRFGDGSTELLQLGLFRVDTVNAATPEGRAAVETSDRMAQVRDEPLLSPFAPTGKPSNAIVDLVDDVFAGLTSHVLTDVGAEANLVDVVFTGDRGKAVTELALAAGADVYFNAAGELVVEPKPDATTAGAPDWVVDAGPAGVLVSHADAIDRATVANGVLVRGQASASTPPIEVLVVDDDPSSRTLWGGPFGRVAVVIESSTVQSLAQATELAEDELSRRLAGQRTLNLVSAPNPALEPGDVVDVVFGDGTTERHLLDTVRVPLDVVGAVQLTSTATLDGGPVELERPRFAVLTGRDAWLELAASRRVPASLDVMVAA